jgi:hypothetical protein
MNKFLQSIHDNLPQWMADWFDVLVPAAEVALIMIGALAIMRIAKLLIGRVGRTYGLPGKAATLTQGFLDSLSMAAPFSGHWSAWGSLARYFGPHSLDLLQ